MKPVHIIILSTKSAGSSALMNYYVKNHSFQDVCFTKHFEKETLFWTKAASLLKLPQDKLYRSKISFKSERVLAELNEFLKMNKVSCINATSVSLQDEIFRAYKDLIFKYAPRFIEKSPHHLYNRSDLRLMLEFILKYESEIDFKVIGLVRNPLDVIYSAWSRWKFIPEEFEGEWLRSYENLLWWKDQFPLTRIMQYEEMAKDNALIDKVIGAVPESKRYTMNVKSIFRWQRDIFFSHNLSKDTVILAKKYGYSLLNSRANVFWYVIVYYHKLRWKVRSVIKKRVTF